MRSYLRNISALGRDIKLFLLFNLLATVGFGVFQLIFNLYLYELDLREDYIGAFSAVQTICMAISAATMGPLLHRFGSWRCIVCGSAAYFVVSLILAFAEHEMLLLALAAISGVGQSYLFITTMPFIMEWSPRESRQQIAAIAFSVISLSITFGSLVGGFAPDLLSRTIDSIGGPETVAAYRWTLTLGTLLAATSLIPLLMMGEARRTRPREEAPSAVHVDTPASRRQIRRDMVVFVLAGGIMSLGVGMVVPFYNVYLTTLGANTTEVGYVFAIGGAVAAILGLGAPAVARRFGSLRAVWLLRVSIVPFYALLIVVPSYWLAIFAHLSRQTSISMSWPIDSTFIGEILPPRARSAVFGLRSGAWNFGMAGASLAAGEIIVRSGYGWTFASMIVFTTLSAILFVGYYRRHPLVRSGQIASALPSRKPAPDPNRRPSTAA